MVIIRVMLTLLYLLSTIDISNIYHYIMIWSIYIKWYYDVESKVSMGRSLYYDPNTLRTMIRMLIVTSSNSEFNGKCSNNNHQSSTMITMTMAGSNYNQSSQQ